MLPRLIRKPKRAKRVKVKRFFPGHRKWIRAHDCCVLIADSLAQCEGQIIPAHVRGETDGGQSLKPHDRWIISLCWKHHNEQTAKGEKWFEDYWGLDMKALAREFAAASPYARELAQ